MKNAFDGALRRTPAAAQLKALYEQAFAPRASVTLKDEYFALVDRLVQTDPLVVLHSLDTQREEQELNNAAARASLLDTKLIACLEYLKDTQQMDLLLDYGAQARNWSIIVRFSRWALPYAEQLVETGDYIRALKVLDQSDSAANAQDGGRGGDMYSLRAADEVRKKMAAKLPLAGYVYDANNARLVFDESRLDALIAFIPGLIARDLTEGLKVATALRRDYRVKDKSADVLDRLLIDTLEKIKSPFDPYVLRTIQIFERDPEKINPTLARRVLNLALKAYRSKNKDMYQRSDFLNIAIHTAQIIGVGSLPDDVCDELAAEILNIKEPPAYRYGSLLHFLQIKQLVDVDPQFPARLAHQADTLGWPMAPSVLNEMISEVPFDRVTQEKLLAHLSGLESRYAGTAIVGLTALTGVKPIPERIRLNAGRAARKVAQRSPFRTYKALKKIARGLSAIVASDLDAGLKLDKLFKTNPRRATDITLELLERPLLYLSYKIPRILHDNVDTVIKIEPKRLFDTLRLAEHHPKEVGHDIGHYAWRIYQTHGAVFAATAPDTFLERMCHAIFWDKNDPYKETALELLEQHWRIILEKDPALLFGAIGQYFGNRNEKFPAKSPQTKLLREIAIAAADAFLANDPEKTGPRYGRGSFKNDPKLEKIIAKKFYAAQSALNAINPILGKTALWNFSEGILGPDIVTGHAVWNFEQSRKFEESMKVKVAGSQASIPVPIPIIP
ncbi:MAG TPA: hypothetical protein VIN59_02140 [Alphaproteobacteria bacterium]